MCPIASPLANYGRQTVMHTDYDEELQKTTEGPIMVWLQTYCAASPRIKAHQIPQEKRCSKHERKKVRGGEMRGKKNTLLVGKKENIWEMGKKNANETKV